MAGCGARAHAMHEGLVSLTLAALGPALAALVVVVAHRHADLREVTALSAYLAALWGRGGAGRGAAHPARVRALLHHREGVVDALARIGPDLALRRILVGALDTFAHAAAVRAFLVPGRGEVGAQSWEHRVGSTRRVRAGLGWDGARVVA